MENQYSVKVHIIGKARNSSEWTLVKQGGRGSKKALKYITIHEMHILITSIINVLAEP